MAKQLGTLTEIAEAIRDNGRPTDGQVDRWLSEHPEATTTVQDGSLTPAKMADSFWEDERLKKVDFSLIEKVFNTVSDQIDEVNKIIFDSKYKVEKEELEEHSEVLEANNYFWNCETDKAVWTSLSSAYRGAEPIDISNCSKVEMTVRVGTSAKQRMALITDADYNILWRADAETSAKVKTITVDVPSNAKYLLITYYLGTSDVSLKTLKYTLYKRVYEEVSVPKSRIFEGLNIAIIGDSISTNGKQGEDKNAVEITVTSSDVGKELKAYLTIHDVNGGLSLGGYTYKYSDVGKEVTFTPTTDDVGKVIGLPNNYNDNARKVWWEVVKDELGGNYIPVCWSGSSITSHEGAYGINSDTSSNTIMNYMTSYSWHDAQIRKCGIRKAGTMERTAPDVIIIYRGTNDFSHLPYATLTNDYFDEIDFAYPTNDKKNDTCGLKEGLVLTISKLRATYPNTKMFVCTLNVFKRVNYAHFPTNNGINTLPQYNNAIREVANYMGCGLIEFDKDGITFENCYSEGYITDSSTIPTHPSDKGHKTMGLKAIADLKAQFSKIS